MKRRTWLGWAFGLGLVVPSACSTGEQDSVDEGLGERGEGAAALTAGNLGPCEDQLSDWSLGGEGACMGAWKYWAHGSCPNDTCACAKHETCTNWTFGADPVRIERSFSSIINVAQSCHEVCVPCDDSSPLAGGPAGGEATSGCNCKDTVCQPPEWDAAKTKCQTQRNNKVNEIKEDVPNAFDYLVHEVPGSFVFSGFVDADDKPKATCAYRIFEPKPAEGTGAVCGCETYQSCPDTSCPSTGPHWSPHGLTRADLSTMVKGQGKILDVSDSHKADCSTCDQWGGASLSSLRYWCLENYTMYGQMPPEHLATAERTEMLVYETYGYELTDEAPFDWLSDARALYSKAASIPACGVSVPSYVCAGGAAGPIGQAGVDFKRCLRLQGSHVDEATAARELATCAEAFAANAVTYAACSSTSGGPSAAATANDALDTLWQKQLDDFALTNEPQGDLGRQVLNFDRWYEGHAKLLTGGAAPTPAQAEALAVDLSAATTLFWNAIDAHFGITAPAVAELNEPSPSQFELRVALTNALTQGDLGARAVVKAAFTPVDKGHGQVVLPAGGLPLLALLGEALGPLAERLDDQALYQDFACQFRDCRPDAASSAIVQLYRILSRLGDAEALGATLGTVSGDLGGWKPVFHALNANRARLDEALLVASAGKGLAGADLALLPPPARPFAKIARNARERATRFEATGLFMPSARQIDSGQDLDTRQAVVNALNAKLGPLVARKDRYQNDLVALAHETLGAMDEAAELTRVKNLIEQKEKVREGLEADVKGLQASADQEEAHLGELLATFHQIEAGLDQNELIDVGNRVLFTASGAHARYTGPGGSPDLSLLAIQPPVVLASGQVLQVQASGNWTPTCGLRQNATKVMKPLDLGETPKSVAVDLSDAVTGPEGYSLQWTGSGFRAGSATTSKGWEFEAGVRGEICAGHPGPAKEFGLSYKACAFAGATYQHSNMKGTSDGNEIRATASFSRGLRLSTMPFPDAPVGSLLAVVKAKKAGGAILDTQVVQSAGTMVSAAQDAEVYFVVNDRACVSPEVPSTNQALTVRATTLVTVKDVAKKAVEAMGDVLAEVRPYEVTYADQGRILPGQIGALRSKAALKLETRLASLTPPVSVSDLPAPLLTLFNAFVDREIVRVERAVEIKAIERQLGLLKLEVEALQDDVLASGEQSAARNLLLGHLLRNLDAEVLRSETAELVVQTRDYLLPMLELWYPKYLAQKREESTFKSKLDALSKSGSLSGDLTTLASSATYLVGELLGGFLEAPFGNKPPGAQLPIVLLSFPRPGARQPNDLTGDFDSHWRLADGTRSTQVWQAILRRQVAHLTINADDIYAFSSTQGTLPCAEAMPVIRGIRFLFASTKNGAYQNADQLNGLGRTLGGFAPERQTFLTELGEAHYSLAPGSVYRKLSGGVLYGQDVSLRALADGSFTNDDDTRPVGLSPLGTYDVDFSDVDAEWPGSVGLGIDEAEEFVVAMQIDSKAVATHPPGVSICEP